MRQRWSQIHGERDGSEEISCRFYFIALHCLPMLGSSRLGLCVSRQESKKSFESRCMQQLSEKCLSSAARTAPMPLASPKRHPPTPKDRLFKSHFWESPGF